MNFQRTTLVKITLYFHNKAEKAVFEQAWSISKGKGRKILPELLETPEGLVFYVSPEAAPKYEKWLDEISASLKEEIDWLELARKAQTQWAKDNAE